MGPDIDASSHAWTPDPAHYPLAPGFKVEGMAPRSFRAEAAGGRRPDRAAADDTGDGDGRRDVSARPNHPWRKW